MKIGTAALPKVLPALWLNRLICLNLQNRLNICLGIAVKQVTSFRKRIRHFHLFSILPPFISHLTFHNKPKIKMQVKQILIVDDDAEDSEFFTIAVSQVDPTIQVAVTNSKEGLFHQLRRGSPCILFIDSFIHYESEWKAFRKLEICD